MPDGQVLNSQQADISEQLSRCLGRSVRLESKAPEAAKLEQYWPEFDGEAAENFPRTLAGDAAQGSFFDYASLHLLTTSSIEAMQKLYPTGRFEVRRFRPNITIDTSGFEGFVENDWVGKTIRLGDTLRIHVSAPCPRCVMPTLAQGDLPADSGDIENTQWEKIPRLSHLRIKSCPVLACMPKSSSLVGLEGEIRLRLKIDC